MYRSSQPSQHTVCVVREVRRFENFEVLRDETYVEVGHYGTEENAQAAADALFHCIGSIAPESFRRGDVRVVIIHPEVPAIFQVDPEGEPVDAWAGNPDTDKAWRYENLTGLTECG